MDIQDFLKHIKIPEIFTGALYTQRLRTSSVINANMIQDLQAHIGHDMRDSLYKHISRETISGIISHIPATGNIYLSETNFEMNFDIIENRICESYEKLYGQGVRPESMSVLFNDHTVIRTLQEKFDKINNYHFIDLYIKDSMDFHFLPIKRWYNLYGQISAPSTILIFTSPLAAMERCILSEIKNEFTFSPTILIDFPIFDYDKVPYIKLDVRYNQKLFAIKDKLADIKNF